MSTHSQEQLFEEALALKKERRYREALPLYEELLRDGFRSAFFLSSAAHLHYLLRENEKALELVESSLRLRKDEPFTVSLKGKILFRLGYRDEALAIFRELSLGALSPGSARDLIMFLSKNGAPDEAAACLERLIETNPSLKELRLLIEEAGNTGQSAPPEKIAQFKDSADGDIYARQIEARIRELKPDEALEELSTLLSIPSRRENRRLLSLHAKMLYGAKRYTEAYEAYEELWKKDPRDRFALSQMAFSLVHTGDYQRAVPLLEEIFTVEPENMYVRNALMKAYRVTGTGDKGALFFKGIVASHPTLRYLWSDIKKLSSFPRPSAPSGVSNAPDAAGPSKKSRQPQAPVDADKSKQSRAQETPEDAGRSKQSKSQETPADAGKSKPHRHSSGKPPQLVSDDDCPFDLVEKAPDDDCPFDLVEKAPDDDCPFDLVEKAPDSDCPFDLVEKTPDSDCPFDLVEKAPDDDCPFDLVEKAPDDDCPFDLVEKAPCEETPPSAPVKKRTGKKKKENR
ncbi:MAG: hypothetical protein AB9903_22170 [Vulcanimicrobiota bacterium]